MSKSNLNKDVHGAVSDEIAAVEALSSLDVGRVISILVPGLARLLPGDL